MVMFICHPLFCEALTQVARKAACGGEWNTDAPAHLGMTTNAIDHSRHEIESCVKKRDR